MRKYTTKQCPVCGKEFTVKPRDYGHKTCSYACGNISRGKTISEFHRSRPKRGLIAETSSNTGQIPLTRGLSAKIDLCDADLAEYKWFALPSCGKYYARRNSFANGSKRTAIQMHRVIAERMVGRSLVSEETIDHINGNGLDNRRSNLRVATKAENCRNSRTRKGSKTGLKGVWKSARNSWAASITFNNRIIYLGSFSSPELAHAAYCEAAKKYHGEFANDGNGAIDHDS